MDRADDDGYWLVLAFAAPPPILRMTPARNGRSWWRRVNSENQADAIGAALDRTSIRWQAEFKSHSVLLRDRLLREDRERRFRAYKQEFAPQPKQIALDPNRDRSSGRQTYAEYRGTPSREAGANPEQ